jgi:hypothetical protein
LKNKTDNKKNTETANSMHRVIFISVLMLIAFGFNSCGVYKLNSGSIPPDVKTISIQKIYNETGQGPTNLSQNLTEKLKAYYQNNSKLILTPSEADWKIDGKIVGYTSSGVAPKGNETSGSNRLTITVKITFTNTTNGEPKDFEQNFSFYQDYEQQKTLFEVESTLTNTILDQIVLDIFQKTTANW